MRPSTSWSLGDIPLPPCPLVCQPVFGPAVPVGVLDCDNAVYFGGTPYPTILSFPHLSYPWWLVTESNGLCWVSASGCHPTSHNQPFGTGARIRTPCVGFGIPLLSQEHPGIPLLVTDHRHLVCSFWQGGVVRHPFFPYKLSQ